MADRTYEKELKENNDKLALLQRQYEEVVQAERRESENKYLELSKKYEELNRKLAQMASEKEAAKKRRENAMKECRQVKKKIQIQQTDVNKLRRKLQLPPLEFAEEEPVSKKFKIFPKDKFTDPEL